MSSTSSIQIQLFRSNHWHHTLWKFGKVLYATETAETLSNDRPCLVRIELLPQQLRIFDNTVSSEELQVSSLSCFIAHCTEGGLSYWCGLACSPLVKQDHTKSLGCGVEPAQPVVWDWRLKSWTALKIAQEWEVRVGMLIDGSYLRIRVAWVNRQTDTRYREAMSEYAPPGQTT